MRTLGSHPHLAHPSSPPTPAPRHLCHSARTRVDAARHSTPLRTSPLSFPSLRRRHDDTGHGQRRDDDDARVRHQRQRRVRLLPRRGQGLAVAVANPQSFVATGVAQQRLTRDTFATEAKPEVSVPTADLSAITGSTGESARAAAGVSATWITPVSGHITSGYGPRPDPPVAGVNLFHKGTDIAGACGTPIRAASGGTVKESSYHGTYGNWMLIDHSGGIMTGYAHNSTLLVTVGDTVSVGQVITTRGSTGASTTAT
ncbi:M23 family metallopeptidase [Rathayibacter toxicus]|uniref:M23 family metallopeptidase n=1 Tax=Rathayibacter toxicus TaxID=145458 RepID=UPI001C04EAD7|nr:M23 family metallopeptidase [Rathayibacter toxicus]